MRVYVDVNKKLRRTKTKIIIVASSRQPANIIIIVWALFIRSSVDVDACLSTFYMFSVLRSFTSSLHLLDDKTRVLLLGCLSPSSLVSGTALELLLFAQKKSDSLFFKSISAISVPISVPSGTISRGVIR